VSVTSVEVREAAADEALAFLVRLEAATGVQPVDEDEQRRLSGRLSLGDPSWDWGPHLVEVDGEVAAYTGVRLAPTDVGSDGLVGRIDVALDRSHPQAQRALAAALADVRDHVDRRGATGRGAVEAWLRGATPEDLATAKEAGFAERRRIHVLGVDRGTLDGTLDGTPAVVPAGLRLRTFDADAAADEDAVVALLTRAYPELQGRYERGFTVLRSSGWFRADDLLLLEDVATGRLLGLHWMKRRSDEVGEVYNLAVDPDAQGRGFGPLLLDAGLAHLVAVGSREILLWVHSGNERALGLYRSRGFTSRWEDVSLIG